MDELDLNSLTILDAVAAATDQEALERLRGRAFDKRRSDVAAACAARLQTLVTLSWVAACHDKASLEQMRHNSQRRRNHEVAWACKKRINVLRMAEWHLHPERPREQELMHWLVDSMDQCQTLRWEVHGRAHRAVRTEQMLRRHGAVATMVRAVLSPTVGPNFVLMTHHGLAEWTIESGCLRFADLFADNPAALAASRARLASVAAGLGAGWAAISTTSEQRA